MDQRTVVATSTPGFALLAKDSEGRNRGPTAALVKALDPNGIHIVVSQMLHNDCEFRTQWLVKISGQEDPVWICMDNSFRAFDGNTKTIQVPDLEDPR